MTVSLAVKVWGITSALVAAALVAVALVIRTGAPPMFVAVGALVVAYLAYASWRSGGRFEFEARRGRPLDSSDPPDIRRAMEAICTRAGRPMPTVLAVRMDVPGAVVGYDRGTEVVAVDPRLDLVVGPVGLEAIFAHELGHLGRDIHTDSIRSYLPQVIGFGVFWTALLAGRGPAVATLGSLLYLVLAPITDRRVRLVRFALSLGVEAVALIASRYANRLEEFRADAFAAELVSPAALTEALYRIAALATGDNDEDVTGPVPWNEDRSALFEAFATHPSIEARANALDCEVPAWARPYRPPTTHERATRHK